MIHHGKPVEIRYIAFPEEVQGACGGFLTESSTKYIIAIDSTRAPLQQRQTLGHELAHLFLDHLEQRDRPVMIQEAEAREMAWTYYRAYKSGALENRG